MKIYGLSYRLTKQKKWINFELSCPFSFVKWIKMGRILIVLAWLCMWESGNRCFRFVSWLIFSNLAFQTILIQYLMSDKTNPQIQILTITEIKSKSGIFVQFQTSLSILVNFRQKKKRILEQKLNFALENRPK